MKIQAVYNFVFFTLLALTVSFRNFGQSNISAIKPVVEERVIPKFHSLHVSGLAVVYLAPSGDPGKVKLEVSGMPIQEVLTTVKDGVLIVTTQGTHKGENIKVYVSSPTVKAITVSRAGILYSQETISAEKLSISVEGVGAAQLAVNTQELVINRN